MWQRNNSEDHVLTSVNKLLLLLLLLIKSKLLSVDTTSCQISIELVRSVMQGIINA